MSRFARRFSSTAEGKVKSFKSFQIIQISFLYLFDLFRFVGFLPRKGHSYYSLSVTTYQCS